MARYIDTACRLSRGKKATYRRVRFEPQGMQWSGMHRLEPIDPPMSAYAKGLPRCHYKVPLRIELEEMTYCGGQPGRLGLRCGIVGGGFQKTTTNFPDSHEGVFQRYRESNDL